MSREWMDEALIEAQKAFEKGEAPIGAVVVQDEEIIGRGHNLVETFQDPAAHAEMLAITAASNHLLSWRLNDAEIYVTLEPCPMCMGAIHLSRMKRLFFGAKDQRLGACGSKVDLTGLDAMRKPIEIENGLRAEEATALLQIFFQKLRQKRS